MGWINLRTARTWIFMFSWIFVFLLAGCQTGRIVNGVFVYEQKGYKVNLLPADWIRNDKEGFDLFYSHRKLSATVGLAVQCGRPTNASLKILTRHLLFGLSDKTILATRERKLSGISMLETLVSVRLGKTRVKMSLVVLKKGNCIYDLEYVARPDVFDIGTADFHRMIDSFALM